MIIFAVQYKMHIEYLLMINLINNLKINLVKQLNTA